MANICSNTLRIIADDACVKDLNTIQATIAEKFSEESMQVPRDKLHTNDMEELSSIIEHMEQQSFGDFDDWDISLDSTDVSYDWDTRWGPSPEFVYMLSRKYPALQFELEFHESGCGIAGRLCIQGGEDTFVLEAGAEHSYEEVVIEVFGWEDLCFDILSIDNFRDDTDGLKAVVMLFDEKPVILYKDLDTVEKELFLSKMKMIHEYRRVAYTGTEFLVLPPDDAIPDKYIVGCVLLDGAHDLEDDYIFYDITPLCLGKF